MISFEKHQPTLQNPEQNPDVETMSIALEQKPLQESPEVQDQLQEAQNMPMADLLTRRFDRLMSYGQFNLK